jgi:DNA-binding CsgD family transcriptional regulator
MTIFDLTYTQARVACLVASGLDNAQIANKLGISACAVRDAVRLAKRGTGIPGQSCVRNRLALALWVMGQEHAN